MNQHTPIPMEVERLMAEFDAHEFATDCREVAGLPYRRPVVSMTDYPVQMACDCTGELEESTPMVRLTNCDLPGETPRERYYRGCNECFVCPACGFQTLFPHASLSVSEIRREHPRWGERRDRSGSAA